MDKWDPAKRLGYLTKKIEDLTQAQQEYKVRLDEWQGIAFLCGHDSFIIALTDIKEIIPCPVLRSIPGVKPWFLGMTNLRGDMLPVTDLQHLLAQIQTKIENNTPILVVQHQGEIFGMVVNKIIGLYRTAQDLPVPFTLNASCAFSPYVGEVMQQNHDIFPVLDVIKLINDPIFSKVSDKQKSILL